MDELGLFFKALPEKGLVEKSRRCKRGKQRLTAAFFVAADGSKISEPVVIWKSKSTRCFENIRDKTKPSMVHYFSNEKAWMRSEIMEDILRLLDRKVQLKRRKIILFLDNAACHPETLQNNFKNIKLISLPKCTTSRLQPLDAGIIRAFKCKYRKYRLLKYVVSRTDEGKNASEIIQDVNIAKAVHWLQVAWRDLSTETIIICFQKCGFGQESVNSITNDNEIDEEFESLLTQRREDDEITVEDFFTFDENLTTSTVQINTDLIDWRQQAREEAIKEVVSDTSSASQAVNVVSDDDDDQEENTTRHLTTSEALQHLDDLLHFSMMENDATLTWSNDLVVKALDSQSRGPVFKNHWVALRSTQPFILPRSIK